MSHAMEDSYFDLLPDDALIGVARMTHGTSVPPKTLLEAVSPFRRVAPLIVNKIRLHNEHKVRLDLHRHTLEFGRDDQREEILVALRACGNGIRCVELISCGHDQLFKLDSMAYARLIAENRPNICKLVLRGEDDYDDIRETVESFAAVFAPRVQELEFQARRYSTALLAIVGSTAIENFKNAPMLRKFAYSGDSLGHLTEFWGHVGKQLESIHLRLRHRADWPATIASIQEHCRNLQICMLHNPLNREGVSEEVFTDLICSFGASLKYAQLHSLDVKHCARITKNCPNLRCEVAEKRNQLERLAVLAESIDTLQLRVRADGEWEKLALVLSRCTSLTTLKIHRKPSPPLNIFSTISPECVEALFRAPRPQLQHLAMKSVVGDLTLALLAEKTGNLRSLVLHFSSSYLRTAEDFLPRLVLANERLECVELADENERDELDSSTYLQIVVEIFLYCPMLRELKVCSPLSMRPEPGLVRAMELKLKNRGVQFKFTFRPTSLERMFYFW